eukprot:g49392.t1
MFHHKRTHATTRNFRYDFHFRKLISTKSLETQEYCFFTVQERHGPWYLLRCFLGCVCHDVTSILHGRLNARVIAGYELLLFLSERGIYVRVLGFDV